MKKSDHAVEPMTAEKAREILAHEAQAQAQSCMAEIQAVLDKYGMALQPRITFIGNQVAEAGVSIVRRQA